MRKLLESNLMKVIQFGQIQVLWGPEAYAIVGALFKNNNAQSEIQNWAEGLPGAHAGEGGIVKLKVHSLQGNPPAGGHQLVRGGNGIQT